MLNEYNTKNQKEFVNDLIDRALNGEHTKREFIRSASDLSVAKLLRTATKQIVDGFVKAVNTTYKKYLKCLENGEDNIDLLMSHLTYKKCLEFYKDELALIIDEIDEFYHYAFITDKFLKLTLFGYVRPITDLYDSRKMKIKR